MIESLWTWAHKIYDVEGIIAWGGTAAITAIVFAETGLMIGFFLPGDSLLVTAGLLAAVPGSPLNFPLLVGLAVAAAVAGDALGYWIGLTAGSALYARESSWWFRREHLLKARDFYERHGGQAIVIARFVPIVRTFAPVVAGIARMTYRRFATFNVWGGVGWVGSMTVLGYTLGQSPLVVKYVHVVIVAVIGLSLVPAFVAWWRERGASRRTRGPSSRGAA